jgi:hypothetical protein
MQKQSDQSQTNERNQQQASKTWHDQSMTNASMFMFKPDDQLQATR